jgi:RNA polymerase sigma-70 factor (ECF subfamily)
MTMGETIEAVSDTPDETLMQRTAAGEQSAFTALVKRHQGPLLNFFHRMSVYTDAEDLVQETFVRLFNYRARYRPTAKFTTFLYTIARHVWVDLIRKTARKEALVENLKMDRPSQDDGGMGRTFARLDAQSALERLPEKLRSVVVLSLYQGLRYEEISVVLGIPTGTVKSRMFNALSQLKEIADRENRQIH